MSSPPAEPPGNETPTVSELLDELEELEEMTDDPALLDHLDDLKELASTAQGGGTFGQVIYGFDRHDVAEAFLGSLIFGIPMAVEGGTNEAGAFVATHALNLVLSLVGTIVLVHGILYVAQFQDVRVANPILGVVPRRLVGVVCVAFITATVLLTLWGRIDWLTDPWLATCTVAVAAVPMSLGAALGDILPGS